MNVVKNYFTYFFITVWIFLKKFIIARTFFHFIRSVKKILQLFSLFSVYKQEKIL